jgi:hypothetical protein
MDSDVVAAGGADMFPEFIEDGLSAGGVFAGSRADLDAHGIWASKLVEAIASFQLDGMVGVKDLLVHGQIRSLESSIEANGMRAYKNKTSRSRIKDTRSLREERISF